MSGGTYSLTSTQKDRFLRNSFTAGFIYFQSFCQKSAERKSPKKYFFISFLLTDLGYEPLLLRLISRHTTILQVENNNHQGGAQEFQRMVCRDTLQGGVLFALLWNLAANSLLRRLEHSGKHVIAYADDIAALEICPKTLSVKLNLALSIVLD